VEFGVGDVAGDLEAPERIRRGRAGEAAAVLGEDDREAPLEPGEQLARDAPVVGAGLP